MYFFINDIPDKVTSFQLDEVGRRFVASSSIPALAEFLQLEVDALKKLAEKPDYLQFFIPKPGGEKRLIESSQNQLKWLQKRLAYFFQAVYYPIRPACAYGAVLATADEEQPRNVYTNALQHIGQKWLVNLDLRNFFHTINTGRIYEMLKRPPFAFNPKAARLLSRLITFEGRLPMGSPTSPILSNLACLPLDEKLATLAEKAGWAYTRFIDDMSFSSKKKFKGKHLDKITEIVREEGFEVNEDKVEVSRIRDEPEVTGLVLRSDKPDVSKAFLRELARNIDVYHALTEPELLSRNIFPAWLIRRFRNFLHGQLNFVKFIRGEGDSSYLKLKARLYPQPWRG